MSVPRFSMLVAALLAVVFSNVQGAEPLRVRVLTYNIHHGEGTDGKLDLNRIAQVIKQADPDVVALQEVDKSTSRSRGVDQAAELGKLTGMHAAFGKAMDYAGGEYGEALLSKYPLTNVTVHPLPFTAAREPRCAVSARVKKQDMEFMFVGTHLEHADAALRLCQSNKLNALLVAGNSLPTILAGDLNDVPDSPVIRVLQPYWQDAGAENPAPTCPADRPKTRIDYIMYRPAGTWRVVEQRVFDESVASDHRPLLVVLQWQGADD